MSQGRSHRLFTTRRRRRAGCLTVLGLLVAALTLVLVLNGLSNRYARLDTRGVTVLNLPRELEGFAILHLSDLNAASLGSNQDNLISALGKEDYQAVVLSGDMVGTSGNAAPLLTLLGRLRPGVPIYLIAGDSDPPALLQQPHGDAQVLAPWVQAAQDAGAIYLETPQRLEYEGRTVWFCPGETFLLDLTNAVFALKELIGQLTGDDQYAPEQAAQLRFAQHRLQGVERSQEALLEMKPEDIIVAVTHHPPDKGQLAELARLGREAGQLTPSLFLAGQFNNGQARLPGLGPVYIPPQPEGGGGFLPGDEGFTGLLIRQGFPLHISPGLGTSGYYPLPLRLFNRPAATLLRLSARMTR